MSTWWKAAVVGLTFLLSLPVGNYLVVWGLDYLVRKGKKEEENESEYLSGPHPLARGVGWVERFIYTSCILLGLPYSVIGGWLVLKGLAQFHPRGKTTPKWLTEYYSYLVGTGLSLIVGVGFGLLGRRLLHLPLVPPHAE